MKYREALAKAKTFGVVERVDGGKGSHRVWIIPDDTAAQCPKGPRATVPCHGEGREIPQGTLKAALRRLGIDWSEFFDA